MKLQAGWLNYRFNKQRSLLNFAIQEAVIDLMSTHWITMEILWLHQEHYTTTPGLQLMELLPDRGWEAGFYRATAQRLSRQTGVPGSKWAGGRRPLFLHRYSMYQRYARPGSTRAQHAASAPG